MIRICILLLCVTLTVSPAVTGQAYYQLKYRSLNNSYAENAFLIIYENGTGLVRTNQTGAGGKRAIYESELTEELVLDTDGTVDTSRTIYSTGKPVFKFGARDIAWNPVDYRFRLNAETTTLEPWMVVDKKDTTRYQAFDSAELIGPQRIADPDFLLEYFSKNEPFYQNRFGPRSRGGKLTDSEKATRLILLVVGSTYDKKIGTDVAQDVKNVFETFGNVALFLGIKPVFDSVVGENYGRQNVLNAVNKLKPKPTDIVVFWYSGHGFSDVKNRDPKKRKMIFPFMDLRDPRQRPRPAVKDSTINIMEIYEKIKAKGGRFNLVISDCCNDEVEPPVENDMKKPSTPKGIPPKWNWDNVYTLFMKPRVSILSTAASQGQRARGDEKNGGVYTKALLSTLVSNMLPDKSNPLWIQILAVAQVETKKKIDQARLPCPLPFQPNNFCRQIPPVPKIN